MLVKLPDKITGIVYGEVVRSKQRPQHLAQLGLAGAFPAPEHQGDPGPLSWPLHEVGHPSEQVAIMVCVLRQTLTLK